ncbi:hypothetical protein P9112_008724 [Eukaryota sp. TZLM1-RC]
MLLTSLLNVVTSTTLSITVQFSYWFVFGFACCYLIWVLSGIVLPSLSSAYAKHFSPSQRAETKSRIVSFVHAYFLFFFVVYLLFIEPTKALPSDHANGFPSAAPMYGISTGYFIFDLFAMIIVGKPLFGMEFVAHHIICIFGWTYLVLTKNGIFYPTFQSLCEATNLFVSLHWFYSHAPGWKGSRAFVVNGFVLWLSFLVFRMSLLFYTAYLIYSEFPFNDLHWFNLGFIALASFVLNGLNCLWFWKITKGLLKHILKKRKTA